MFDVKILVVDDNDGDLLLFEESIDVVQTFLLGKDIAIDFEIVTANDGLEALEILKNQVFDIIFLDIKMPKMDGIETLEKIKEKNDRTYIVMFTTSDYEEDIKKTHKLKASGYLLKSLDIIEFEENLKSALMLFLQSNFVYLQTVNHKYKNFLT